MDAGRSGKDRDGVHGEGGSDSLDVMDGDFRDSAICGPGPDDFALADLSFNFETGVLKVDGTSGCENVQFTSPDSNAAANGSPTNEEAVAASEAKVE